MQDALEDFDWEQEPENYTNEPTTSVSIYEFKNLDERIAKFKSSLINPQGVGNPDSFFYSILYALRYQLTDKSEPCVYDSKLKSDLKAGMFDEFDQLRDKLKLDLDILKFENQCFQIN